MAKIIGHGAPTSKTFGVLGQEYFDKDSNKVYTCTKVTHKTAYRAGEADAEYEWMVIGNDPFEVKKEIITIVPEQSVTSEYNQDTPVGTVCMNRFPKNMDLIDGAKYIVCINNKNYEITAKEVMGAVVIGDPFLYGAPVDSTGEPFFFMVMHEDPTQYVFVWKAEFGTTVTTSITCEQEIFEKIDYKFMPEGYPKVEKKMVEIVPEQSVTKEIDMGGVYFNPSTFPNISFKENCEYRVVINGVEYVDTLHKNSKNNSVLGNGEIDRQPELSGFPFVFLPENDGVGAGFMWHKSLGEPITLSVSTEQEVVQQIDPKLSGVFKVRFTLDPTTYALTADKTPKEVWEAMCADMTIDAKVYQTNGSIAFVCTSYVKSPPNDPGFVLNGYNTNVYSNTSPVGEITSIMFGSIGTVGGLDGYRLYMKNLTFN